MASAHPLTNHDEIRRWADERGGRPACVRGTGRKGDTGMIRIDFPGWSGEQSLQEISWDEWFKQFDENNLALMVQDQTARGQQSNFNKLVSREAAEGKSSRGLRKSAARKTSGRTTGARKTSGRKTSARKTSGRKTSARKTSGRKAAGRKTSSRKTSGRSSASRKTSSRGAASTRRTSSRKTGSKSARASSRKGRTNRPAGRASKSSRSRSR